MKSKKRSKKIMSVLLAMLILLQCIPVMTLGAAARPTVQSAATSTSGDKVMITFSKKMAALPASPAGFSVSVKGVANPVKAVKLNSCKNIVELVLTNIIYKDSTDIRVSYKAGTVKSADGGVLASFNGKKVTNKSTAVKRFNATISPTTATFYIDDPKDVALTMYWNGNKFYGIKNGKTSLVKGSDYAISGNTVKILKSYLSKQAVGKVNLTFDFATGIDPVLNLTVEDNPEKSEINPHFAFVDINEPADITVFVNQIDKLKGLYNEINDEDLQKSVDYTVSQNKVTILKSYLSTLSLGRYYIKFDFDGDDDASLIVDIDDYEAGDGASIEPFYVLYDHWAPADIKVTMTPNGRKFLGLEREYVEGFYDLVKGRDYEVNGDVVTLFSSYLQSAEEGYIYFDFETGLDWPSMQMAPLYLAKNNIRH